jgi:flagellar protein FliO/FliZ
MAVSTYLQFFLALIFVIGLILALSWVLRRFGLGSGMAGTLGRKRRLFTVESAALDGRHRVILLRRDNVEHLVLIGPNTSQVIERGIPAPETPEPMALPPQGPLASFSQFLSKDKQP